MLPLFFIPVLLNPTYSFTVCSISIVIISVQYLQSASTTISVTAVNSIYLLMISWTSYFSSYNPLFIPSVQHKFTSPYWSWPRGTTLWSATGTTLSNTWFLPPWESSTPGLSGFAHSSTDSILELSLSFEKSRTSSCCDLPWRAESLTYKPLVIHKL